MKYNKQLYSLKVIFPVVPISDVMNIVLLLFHLGYASL
jgi:hypothetical protein